MQATFDVPLRNAAHRDRGDAVSDEGEGLFQAFGNGDGQTVFLDDSPEILTGEGGDVVAIENQRSSLLVNAGHHRLGHCAGRRFVFDGLTKLVRIRAWIDRLGVGDAFTSTPQAVTQRFVNFK